MKKLLLALILSSAGAFAQTPCDSGTAGSFPCDDYFLQSNLTLNTFSAASGNDSWGWTDSTTNKEYALMGLSNGTAFIDITDPVNPIYLGKLPSHSGSSEWRDIKVYQDYAFVVSEASGHGMQVFDLTRLRGVTNPPENFTEDAHYDGFSNSHNLAINEDTGFAYGVGTNTFSGGPHFVDISDPLNPVGVGGYSGYGYSHDGQVVTYNGPDSDYTNREIYIGSNQSEVVILDVTNKANPVPIANISYSNVEYTHQGWFTEDHKYFIVGDELDEMFVGNPTRLIVMDFTDLDNPQHHFDYIGTTDASDHNLYVVGDLLYLSNYTAGLRIYDISDIDNQQFTEVGYFDTYPPDDDAGAFVGGPGAWNVYPFFDSGNIVISNYSDNGGLFVVKQGAPGTAGVNDFTSAALTMFPNPTTSEINIQSTETVLYTVEIFDITGKRLMVINDINQTTARINVSSLAEGMYMVRVNDRYSSKLIKN